LVSKALEYINESEKKEMEHGYKEVIDELDLIIKTIEDRVGK